MPLENRPLYSAGDCPVCPGSGLLLYLRRADVKQYFFFCTSCGNAYRERQDPPNACNEINSLREVAPQGIALPDVAEVSRVQGLTQAPGTEFDDLMWHVEREYRDLA